MLAELVGEGGLIAIVVIAVLLFGGAMIPKLARSLGSARSNFEKGLEEGKADAASANGTSAATGTPAPTPTPSAEEKSQGA